MIPRKMKPTTAWAARGMLLTVAACLICAPYAGARQAPATPAGAVPVTDVVARLSKDSGMLVLTDSTLKVSVAPLKTKTTPANVEQQIQALVKALPAGTIWGKLYLPTPKTGTYKGDDVTAFAFASGQLFGPVGAPEPADTVEIMGRRIPADSAKDIIALLKLKPVYLLSNPRLGRNGFLVEGPAGSPLIAVNPDQAAATALAAQPGNVTRVEMGYEKGLPVYQFDVNGVDGRKYEVRINGSTGEVLSNRPD